MTVTHPERTTTRLTLLVRLADWSYRRRRRVLAAWIVLLIETVAGAGTFGGSYHFTFTTPNSDSKRAQDLLESRFTSRSGDDVNVVFESTTGTVDDPAARTEIDATLRRFGTQPHVRTVVSPFSVEGARQISKDRKVAYGTLRLDQTVSDYKQTDGKKLLDLRSQLDRPELKVELSGFVLGNAEQSDFSSEGIGLLVAALILLVSFGSL